jgi:hypothetical protein
LYCVGFFLQQKKNYCGRKQIVELQRFVADTIDEWCVDQKSASSTGVVLVGDMNIEPDSKNYSNLFETFGWNNMTDMLLKFAQTYVIVLLYSI